MPILSCGEKLGGVQGMVLLRDVPDGGSLWVLFPPPPPPPPDGAGAGLWHVGDSCGSWDGEYLPGRIF